MPNPRQIQFSTRKNGYINSTMVFHHDSQENQNWTLFCPNEAYDDNTGKGLMDLWGEELSTDETWGLKGSFQPTSVVSDFLCSLFRWRERFRYRGTWSPNAKGCHTHGLSNRSDLSLTFIHFVLHFRGGLRKTLHQVGTWRSWAQDGEGTTSLVSNLRGSNGDGDALHALQGLVGSCSSRKTLWPTCGDLNK